MAVQIPKLPPKFKMSLNFFKGKKRLLIILAIILILSIGIGITNYLKPLEAKVLTVHPQKFTKGFLEEGKIIAAQEWQLFNEVDGKLESLKVQNGDKVTKDQLLFEIDTTDLKFQLETLKGQLLSLEGQRSQNYKPPFEALIKQQKSVIEQAQKDWEAQELNLSRMKSLFEAGAISLVQYEEVQRSTEKAKSFLDQQKHGLDLIYEQQRVPQGTELYFKGQKDILLAQVKQLEEKISKAKAIAPNDGFIKDITVKEGMLIPQGQLLMSVFQDTDYEVESYVLASDALTLKAGSPIEIIIDTIEGDKSFRGNIRTFERSSVEKISPLGLKENRVKVINNLSSDIPLVIGASADVKFTTFEEEGKISVPKTALFPYKGGHALWIIKDSKAIIRTITKGLENDREVLITEGLTEGEQVLLDLELKGLKEGKRVHAL